MKVLIDRFDRRESARNSDTWRSVRRDRAGGVSAGKRIREQVRQRIAGLGGAGGVGGVGIGVAESAEEVWVSAVEAGGIFAKKASRAWVAGPSTKVVELGVSGSLTVTSLCTFPSALAITQSSIYLAEDTFAIDMHKRPSSVRHGLL